MSEGTSPSMWTSDQIVEALRDKRDGGQIRRREVSECMREDLCQ